MIAYTYNVQALIGLITVNLLMAIWIGLIWSGVLKGRAADRLLAVGTFVIFGAAIIHAVIQAAIAR